MNLNSLEVYKIITDIVRTEIQNQGLLNGNWRLGEVTQVISNKRIRAKVDGSETDQLIPSNPDVIFNIGDQIWVIFINGNSRDKFALSRRAI